MISGASGRNVFRNRAGALARLGMTKVPWVGDGR